MIATTILPPPPPAAVPPPSPSLVVYCPPPPPPPRSSSLTYNPDFEVLSPEAFISTDYSDKGISSHSRVVRILPFRCNVFVTSSRVQATDFREPEWLFKYASTEAWYEKPGNATLERMKAAKVAGIDAHELAVHGSKPTEIQTPKA